MEIYNLKGGPIFGGLTLMLLNIFYFQWYHRIIKTILLKEDNS